MLFLYRHLKNHSAKNSQNFLETGIQAFKLLFYAALTLGIIWNLLYFGFVINALPDFDAPTIVGYIISIFGIGIIVIFALMLTLLLPGLTAWPILSEIGHRDKIFKNPLLYIYFSLSICISILLSAEIPYLKETIAILILIIFLVLFLRLIYKKWGFRNCLHGLKKCWGNIIEWLKKLKHPLKQLAKILVKTKENFQLICISVASSLMFLLGTILIIVFVLIAIDTAKITTFQSIEIVILTLVILFFVSIINGIISLKGYAFIKTNKNLVLYNILIYLAIAATLVAYFSVVGAIVKKPNLFLIVPYRILKIGQIPAYISLDENFVKKTQLREKGYLPEQCQTTFKFKILSNIGTEYIVEYPAESTKDKPAAEITQPSDRRILRIPKTQVLLVEYPKEQK